MNVVITGCSSGIGYELVKAFARKGKPRIYALSRNTANLRKLQGECKEMNHRAEVIPFSIDLNSHVDLKKMAGQFKKKKEKIDILINNAGLLISKPFPDFGETDLKNTFDTNFFSVFKLIQLLLPFMRQGSHIVNISSMGGFQGSKKFPGLTAYSASKGALAIMTECLAEEFKGKSISVNCLCLGAVQTEMFDKAFPGNKAPVSPENMAKWIFGFAQNGQKYFNGKIIPVALSTP